MDFAHLQLAALNFSTLPEQLANGLLLGAIYALIALGYTMVYGVLKLINFAHGEVYMLGAYIALFGSYFLGFGPDSTNPQVVLPAVVHAVNVIGFALLVAGVISAIIGRALKGKTVGDILFSGGLAAVFLGAAAHLIAVFQPAAV